MGDLELGSAEERCGRRRRDNYVNCVIELPKFYSQEAIA